MPRWVLSVRVVLIHPDNSLATLITSDDTGGVISVRGTRDKSQVALKVTEAGSGLWLLGPDGGKRVAMDAHALGGDLSLYDSAAKARATLLVLPEGVEFALRARDESKRAVVSVTPNDAGAVQTFHPEGPRSGSMPTF